MRNQLRDQFILQVPHPGRFSASLLGMVVIFQAAAVRADTYADDWQTQFKVTTFEDARTDDNASSGSTLWTIDNKADVYSKELYERPVASMDETVGSKPASETYYEFIDISTGSIAIDKKSEHAYFSIDLTGDAEVSDGTSVIKGFSENYRIRFSSDRNFASEDGEVSSYMIGVKDPSGNVSGSFNDSGSSAGTQIWFDDPADGAVTGTGLSITDEGTSGYAELTSEGSSSDIRARIDGNSIQFALNYGNLGLEKKLFRNLIFEANKGVTDPQNSFFNDAYSFEDAGSPYDTENPPGSIYEVDTLLARNGGGMRAAPVPEMGSGISAVFLIGAMFYLFRPRRFRLQG